MYPIAQLIPEDAFIFGGKLYEQSSVDIYIRDSLTKQLSRSVRVLPCVKGPLNPLCINYKYENRDAITNKAYLLEIIDSLVSDVDNR